MIGATGGGEESLGELLRRYRGARGMTQADLAERSGLSVQGVSMLERGVRRSPRSTTVEFLAEALRLDASERAALEAAARQVVEQSAPPIAQEADRDGAVPAARPEAAEVPGPPPGRGRRRWRRRRAAVGAVLLASLIAAAMLAWWPAGQTTTDLSTRLIGARSLDWHAANQVVGPLQTQRIYHDRLPASFLGAVESRLPPGVVPIVSYREATANVAAYVRSVNRPIVLIFRYNPERQMSAERFTSQFEIQSDLIRSAHNPDVQVGMSAAIYEYQPAVNVSAAGCGYIPPAAYVDYYLAAVYEPYLQGIDRTDHGGFVRWQRCTAGLHRPRGLVEYGLGLGVRGSASCQPESKRTGVMYHDLEYLHENVPDLRILEYWWKMNSNSRCSESWQFPAGSSTADLWRTMANRAFGF
jgi:transcriptional regulator with XRE-family HTH domain